MSNELSYVETLNLAAYAVNNNDLAGALRLCKSVDIDSTPDQKLNLIHAAILNQLGMQNEAIEIYKWVIENDTENQLAKFQLGIAYFFSGAFEEAETVWQGLSYFSHFVDGLFEAKNKNYDVAIKHIKLFIANNSEYPALNIDASNLVHSFEKQVTAVKQSVVAGTKQDTELVSKGQELDDTSGLVGEDNPAVTSHGDVTALLSIYKDK